MRDTDGQGGALLFSSAVMTVTKASLRRFFLNKRQDLSPDEQYAASQCIAAQLVPFLERLPPKMIGAYVPMRGEVDILSPLSSLRWPLSLPVLKANASQLHFFGWQSGEQLQPNSYGVEEPVDRSSELMPTLVLVPLLAYDHDGYRLGYGGGWYDRTLAYWQSIHHRTITMGIAYDWQARVSALPHEAHDQALDGVITPRGITLFRYLSNHYT